MPVATSPAASPRPSTLSKMEDRKRPAIGGADDLAPPNKRVAVNGSKIKDDPSEMKEEGWIEVRDQPALVRLLFSRCNGRATAHAVPQQFTHRVTHFFSVNTGFRPPRGAAA